MREFFQQLIQSTSAPVSPSWETACRSQPYMAFQDGGTLCGKCGRQVANACVRAALNDAWLENEDEDSRIDGVAAGARMAAAARED